MNDLIVCHSFGTQFFSHNWCRRGARLRRVTELSLRSLLKASRSAPTKATIPPEKSLLFIYTSNICTVSTFSISFSGAEIAPLQYCVQGTTRRGGVSPPTPAIVQGASTTAQSNPFHHTKPPIPPEKSRLF